MAQKPSNPNQKPGAFGNKVVREDVLAAFNRGDKAALVSAKSVVLPDPKTETMTPAPLTLPAQQSQHTPQEQARLNSDLLRAVNAGNISKARVALNAGANVNSRNGAEEATICFDDALQIGQTSSSNNGDTALMSAVRSRHYDMADLLLRHGANPDLDYGYGSCPLPTALTYARRNNDSQMIALLQRHGATNEGSK